MNGLCECGCGEKTTVANKTDRHANMIKGVPMRFRSGHHIKNKHGEEAPGWKGGTKRHSEGYLSIKNPSHQRASAEGYVYEHLLIAESALAKPLPAGAVVHHVNRKRGDNSNGNLVICQDTAYHLLLHQRERAFRATGHANYRRCYHCHEYDAPENLYLCASGNKKGYHRKCHAAYEYQRKRKLKVEPLSRDCAMSEGGEE